MYGEIAGIITIISFAVSYVLARKIEDEATPIFQNLFELLLDVYHFL